MRAGCSIFCPAPASDADIEKRIALTRMIGIPLLLVVWASLLMHLLPNWVGVGSAIAEAWVGSALIGRIRRLRKQAD